MRMASLPRNPHGRERRKNPIGILGRRVPYFRQATVSEIEQIPGDIQLSLQHQPSKVFRYKKGNGVFVTVAFDDPQKKEKILIYTTRRND